MNETTIGILAASLLIFMTIVFMSLGALSTLESINNQITEIRSQPQTYCIKYKPSGE